MSDGRKCAERSRSSSCIPILSRKSFRPSQQGSRVVSSGRLTATKLSDKNVSTSLNNLLELPRLSYQRSGSFTRQALCTPLGQRISLSQKSPLGTSAKKHASQLFDKQWQYDQNIKVRKFINDHSALDYNCIKSGISVDMFVQVMCFYAQLIDKRNMITRENYIDGIPGFLKRYRYPANIKPSLMKSVNTPHSWPHILAILSWLTDIVYALEMNENSNSFIGIEKLVEEYMLKSYQQWNTSENCENDNSAIIKEFQVHLLNELNIDEGKIDKLNEDLDNLQQTFSKYKQKNEELHEEVNNLMTEIKSTDQKCDDYVNAFKKQKQDLLDETVKYTANIQTLNQTNLDLAKTEEELEKLVATQPYKINEEQHLREEVEELKNTIKLITDKHEQQQELIVTCDFQLSDFKQKFEQQVYKCNHIITQMELINPEFKDLHIRENGFAQQDMKEEIEQTKRLVEIIFSNLKQNEPELNRLLEENMKRNKELDEQFATSRREAEDAGKIDAEMGYMLIAINKDHKRDEQIILSTIDELRKTISELTQKRINLKVYEDELETVTEKKRKLIEVKEELKKRASRFFPKLTAQVTNNYKNYMAIMNNISSKFNEVLKRATEASEECVTLHEQAEQNVNGRKLD